MAPLSRESGAAEKRAPADILSRYVAVDPESQRLLEQAKKVAASASTVLIRGESGTGKDLLASVIHFLSPHADEPLIKIDCGTLPPELVESELFGYERGAFTGASQMKRGRMELAGAGAIVLDEVAALTMPMQAKLLRVIEEKRFQRLGGHRVALVRARIMALTNIDLERAVAQRSFREDLYYRLNVIPLLVPPLRHRPGDVRPLARQLMAQLCDVHRRPPMEFSSPALEALENYAWPGNVRELRNLVERLVVNSAAPQVQVEDLPAHMRTAAGAGPVKKLSLEELERAYIAEILDYTRGSKGRAAHILGISRKTLLEKRKRYGLN